MLRYTNLVFQKEHVKECKYVSSCHPPIPSTRQKLFEKRKKLTEKMMICRVFSLPLGRGNKTTIMQFSKCIYPYHST